MTTRLRSCFVLFTRLQSYPKPMDPETFGRADEIIGKWLKGRDRSSVVLATQLVLLLCQEYIAQRACTATLGHQVCGRSNYIDWIRADGSLSALTPEQIVESVEGSLRRLGTDYIDLLQIEWPDRYVGWIADDWYDYESEHESVDFETQLMALQGLVDSGKVRTIGVSNETPYGIMKFCEHAEWDELPKIQRSQLLCYQCQVLRKCVLATAVALQHCMSVLQSCGNSSAE
eukprot:14007-Heterococcus_DN1.PRE.2